ncbi:sugar ABC transporter substrate-binding protein [Spirochaetia bacterium]|nr:sugar ABC transporter substrate-binding protein [Spirochaetia bacterium]
MKTGKILVAGLALLLVLGVNVFAGGGGQQSGGGQLTLRVLTHRTDRHQDGFLAKLVEPFEKANNCKVVFESYTDYSGNVATMMNTKNYGDVLGIIASIKQEDLGNFFEPLGSYADLNKKYNWADNKMYNNTVYGIAMNGNVSGGITYNKKVWAQAGITTLPKTPEAFLAALQQIKDRVPNVIPLYTNYNANWTIGQWNGLALSVSGNPNYNNELMINKKNIFEPDSAYYKVNKLLYDVYRQPALHELDPMTTDWEGSKPAINNGQIATMVMGSWAVSQFQAEGPNPQDIGYMPAPFNTNGKQYATSGADYNLGVNKNSDAAHKELGKKFVVWFAEESGWAQAEKLVPTLKGAAMPDWLEAFNGVELFTETTAPDALIGVWDAINKESAVNLGGDESGNYQFQIADAAFTGKPFSAVEAIFAAQNARWNATRDANDKLKAYRP